MTPDEFRALFNRVRRRDQLLMVEGWPSGDLAIVVGLNGDKAIMHGDREIPLARLAEHPFLDETLIEREEAA